MALTRVHVNSCAISQLNGLFMDSIHVLYYDAHGGGPIPSTIWTQVWFRQDSEHVTCHTSTVMASEPWKPCLLVLLPHAEASLRCTSRGTVPYTPILLRLVIPST